MSDWHRRGTDRPEIRRIGSPVKLTHYPTVVKTPANGAFGFTNYRVRCLLHAGKPNWDLLATITLR